MLRCAFATVVLLLAGASSAAAQADDQTTGDFLGGFRTPSGNIHCQAFEVGSARQAELRCDVLQNAAPIVKRPSDCELDYGNAFVLRERGVATRLCHGDTTADPSLPVLAYGRRWTRRGLRCDLSPARLRCINADGRSFELSRRAQKLG